MKIKWSGIGIVAGRGKIGGSVGARNRSGSYARVKVTPTNPRSAAQSFVRALFGALSMIWRTLTEDARREWNAAVANWQKTDVFGDLITPSGFNLFMRLNQVRQLFGFPVLTSPPSPAETFLINNLEVATLSNSSIVLTANETLIPGDMGLMVYSTPPLSAGISFVKSEYRLVKQFGEGEDFSGDLLGDYGNVFGVPVVGQKIFFKLVPVNVTTGQQSAGFETVGLVA